VPGGADSASYPTSPVYKAQDTSLSSIDVKQFNQVVIEDKEDM